MAVPTLNGTPTGTESASGPSFTLPAFTTTVAGKVLVAVTVNEGNVTSVTGGSLTFAQRGISNATPDSDHIEVWEADSAGALSGVVFTVTLTASFATGVVFCIAGGNDFDVNGSLPNAGTSGNRTVSTTATESLVYSAFRYGATEVPTAPTDWTLIYGGGYTGVFYRTFGSAQTGLSCPDGGSGAGDNNGGVADAIAAPGAGGSNANLFAGKFGAPFVGKL